KPHTTRQKASTSASARSDSAGNPAPLAEGPATSTKTISAYVVLRGLKLFDKASTRGSGTLIAPRLTCPRPGVPALCNPVRALKSVVFPDCAYPTRPAFMRDPPGRWIAPAFRPPPLATRAKPAPPREARSRDGSTPAGCGAPRCDFAAARL